MYNIQLKSRKKRLQQFEKEWILPTECRTPVLKRRIALIEKCSNIPLKSIPKITHSLHGNSLKQYTPLLKARKFSHLKPILKKSFLIDLANDIEKIHEKGLVHGDIHPKNIIFTGDQFFLVDFEPIAEYGKNSLRYYCSTPPWIAHEDLKNKKLSPLTDRIGFMHVAMKVLDIKLHSFNALKIYRERRKSDYPIGGIICDQIVKNIKCTEIINTIWNKHFS